MSATRYGNILTIPRRPLGTIRRKVICSFEYVKLEILVLHRNAAKGASSQCAMILLAINIQSGV